MYALLNFNLKVIGSKMNYSLSASRELPTKVILEHLLSLWQCQMISVKCQIIIIVTGKRLIGTKA